MPDEIHYTKLRPQLPGGNPPFDTTQSLPGGLCAEHSLIGQERAVVAFKLGFSSKFPGYNIFAVGPPGTGKTSFAAAFAKEYAQTQSSPEDLAYIHNFDNPREPRLLTLPPGLGRVLAQDIEELLEQTYEELNQALTCRSFENGKQDIVRRYQEQRNTLIKEASEEAQKVGFGSKTTSTGIYFVPIINGEPLSDESFDELSETQKEDIERTSETLSRSTSETLRNLKDYESKIREEVSQLEYSTSLFALGRLFTPVINKYAFHSAAVAHLRRIKEDILTNLPSFINTDSEEEDSLAALLPWHQKRSTNDIFGRYNINLLTDNSKASGAPVVQDYHPSHRLTGEIEYDNEYGSLTTDFRKIRPGLLHKANGGFLILQAGDVFAQPNAWETLRRALITGEISIEPPRESFAPISGLRPEPAKLSVKVVLVGPPELYAIACSYAEDFQKLFKISADFDQEIPNTEANILATARFIRDYAEANNLRHLDFPAVWEVCVHSSRLAGSASKLSGNFNKLSEVLIEANILASAQNTETVGSLHILQALRDRELRINLQESKLTEMLERRQIMIDTEGAKIGQINALAVFESCGHSFGKPSRITCTTYVGKAGIINIEKEAELSGPIHDKGVMVLAGYLGQTYAQDFPLNISARIAFEQTYNGIDGDSASLAELIALLSSLSNLPICQGIAVTGSVNQRGEVQAVGGIIQKVEGFFALCKLRGLNGRHGVAIPESNLEDLVLSHEMVEAVSKGLFHIYPLKHTEEALELLLERPAGRPHPSTGQYPPKTVHSLVYRRLRRFAKHTLPT